MAWGKHKGKQFIDEYGNDKTTGITAVYFQPINQTYPAGRIAMTKCFGNTSRWIFETDVLTDNMHYDIYVTTSTGTENINSRQIAPESIPNLG